MTKVWRWVDTWAFFPCLVLAMACGAGSGLFAHTESAARTDRVSNMTLRACRPQEAAPQPHHLILTALRHSHTAHDRSPLYHHKQHQNSPNCLFHDRPKPIESDWSEKQVHWNHPLHCFLGNSYEKTYVIIYPLALNNKFPQEIPVISQKL